MSGRAPVLRWKTKTARNTVAFKVTANRENPLIRAFNRTQASLAKRLFWRSHLAEATEKLQTAIRELPDTGMMLTIPLLFTARGYYSTLRLRQNMVELRDCVNAVKDLPLRRVAEIGTYRGGTLFVWCQIATPDARVFSLDLPGGEFGGGCNERALPFFQAFRKPGQTLECIRGDSHAPEVRAEFERRLGGELLDFLFIDGDHRYAGVKQDFETYAPFVRRGGIIGFHDIVERPTQPDIQVHRFWTEMKARHRHVELIDESGGRRAIGIGLLFKD